MTRRINDKGLTLLKDFEKCRLRAYLDQGGVPTIGYGQTGIDIQMGMVIDQATADAYLLKSLDWFETGVTNLVTIPLTDNQFSALVCFAYNVGLRAFKDSTLRARLNEGKYMTAAGQFTRWDKVDGVESKGLLLRREAERDLFNTPTEIV